MPRQVRGGALSLLLFLTSLLIGRLAVRDVTAAYRTVSQSSTATPTVPTPTRVASPTPAREPTPTLQLSGTVILDQDNVTTYRFPAGSFVHPLRMVARGREIYLVDTGQLKVLLLTAVPSCRPIEPADNAVEGVPLQEVTDIALSGDRVSLLLLDRAGNVFRYWPGDNTWEVERLASMPGASSRQHLVSVRAYGDAWYLLDSNVGEIWRHNDAQAEVIPAEADLRESADFAVSQDVFVLAQGQRQGTLILQKLSGVPLTLQTDFVPPSDLTDPSWLLLDRGPGGHLYVIDTGYSQLRVLDPKRGSLVRDYRFAEPGTEIQSVYVDQEKLYLASKDVLYVHPSEPLQPPRPQPAATPDLALSPPAPHDPTTLELLPPVTLPVEGSALPDMAFRLPGAPRSYRYGVHEGLDFYRAAGAPVTRDTPVLAAADGKVVRVDVEYAAPSWDEMEEMLAHAREVYHSPADILDVLRGRQVWIDHGEGIVTRYCHLDSVAEGLTVGQEIRQGQLIGYAGNSGTPAASDGQDLEVHLHLEIRIGDGYLGQFLRPIETKRWLKQAFAEGT